MKKFTRWLNEVKRDNDRASRLISNIQKRYGKRDSILTGKNRDGTVIDRIRDYYPDIPRAPNTAIDKLKSQDPKAKIEHFFISDLTPAQRSVHAPSVVGKINGTDPGDKGPIRVVSWKDKHYVVDGHHRYMAAKAKGEEEIQAYHHKIPDEGKKR